MFGALLLPARVYAESPRVSPSLGISFERVQKREMTELGGPDNSPDFRHFRVASRRLLVTGNLRLLDRCTIALSAGTADLKLHSSEGQTRSFEPAPAFRAALRARLISIPGLPAHLYGSAEYLWLRAENDRVSRTHEHSSLKSWDEVSVSWSEFRAGFRIGLETEDLFAYTGVRYADIDASERGIHDGISLSGQLSEESHFSVPLGFDWMVSDRLAAHAEAEFVAQNAFSAGMSYRF